MHEKRHCDDDMIFEVYAQPLLRRFLAGQHIDAMLAGPHITRGLLPLKWFRLAV